MLIGHWISTVCFALASALFAGNAADELVSWRRSSTTAAAVILGLLAIILGAHL